MSCDPASVPIPNDDLRCHCTLGLPQDGKAVTLTGSGPDERVSIDPGCPLHGHYLKDILESMESTLSRLRSDKGKDHDG